MPLSKAEQPERSPFKKFEDALRRVISAPKREVEKKLQAEREGRAKDK